MPTRVLLLRHGQSTWNAEGRWQGQADPPLSDDGRLAAKAFAATADLREIDAVVSSDLVRALETATTITDACGWAPPTTLRGLRERDAGEWEGLTREEIESSWPGALTQSPRIPGGETAAALTSR